MGKTIFISYSHKDEKIVNEITDKIKKRGHDVRIDKSFLDAGAMITPEIIKNMLPADHIVVFLSSNSVGKEDFVGSKWVSQEIYEAISMELDTKRGKLIPCLLDDCKLPEAFTKLKTYNRLYLDFVRNKKEDAIDSLLKRLEKNNPDVFQGVNYLRLNLAFPDLKIYMTGPTVNWGRNSELRYAETLDSYLLFGFVRRPGESFKHFALCEQREVQLMIDRLQQSGYVVTGDGDEDIGTGMWRIPFLIRGYPTSGAGVFMNNKWPD